MNGGVYQLSVPRANAVLLDGMEVPPAMGVATAIHFQPTGAGMHFWGEGDVLKLARGLRAALDE